MDKLYLNPSKKQIIYAIPGSGKTYFKNRYQQYNIVDTDDMLYYHRHKFYTSQIIECEDEFWKYYQTHDNYRKELENYIVSEVVTNNLPIIYVTNIFSLANNADVKFIRNAEDYLYSSISREFPDHKNDKIFSDKILSFKNVLKDTKDPNYHLSVWGAMINQYIYETMKYKALHNVKYLKKGEYISDYIIINNKALCY